MRVIFSFLFLLTYIISSSCYLSATENNSTFALIDKDPWKQSWVQEKNGDWKLTLLFDKAIIFTYFKHKPQLGSFLGFSESNKPYKQEVIFPDEQCSIILSECQFERFGDGSYCWAFKIEKSFSRTGQHFTAITTAIIDDPVQHNNEYRYSLWR